jgi:2-polyprenyl-3-methyl-5-hydroxy-6-metoxy-1,4-benzoquinol methylase
MTASDAQMVPFADPTTGQPLEQRGDALLAPDGSGYPVRAGIARFVDEGYAAGFGHEWQLHAKTQLDSQTGQPYSRERLERCLGAPLATFAGRTVLEAGGGAGRFTELLVGAGALVHVIDMSSAVDVNRANVGDASHHRIAQADLMAPPFAAESFDVVVCLGVLQHTPDPEAALASLWRMVAPGGLLVLDHYTWSLARATKLDALLRPVIKRLAPERAKRVTDRMTAWLFPLHWAVRDVTVLGIPLPQVALGRISPLHFYYRRFPALTREEHYDLSRLDTFDHLADRYKRLRTRGQIAAALSALQAEDITVWKGGNGVEARCRKPVPRPQKW